MTTPRARRAGIAALASTTVLATALATGPTASAADPSPEPAPKAPVAGDTIDVPSKLKGIDRSARGKQTVFVQLAGAGSADVAKQSTSGSSATRSKVKARRTAVAKLGSTVLSTAKTEDSGAEKLFTISNSVPGVALRLDADGIEAVAERTDVVKVSRIVPKQATNSNTVALTRAYDTWKYAGGVGKGVKIGVIDTGIDYTHSDFGGPGTKDAFEAAQQAEADADWRTALPALARAKVVGGKDFVGDGYWPDEFLDDGSENPKFEPAPKPDENPLDCNGHGTHVAGTAAGYGVNRNGSTFTGSYAKLAKPTLAQMKVGPGTAPAASLFGLKVFGCEGSTDYVLPALDWALDPNGDGDFSDHLDIVNMSLGSDEIPADDPENAVVDELTTHGVLSVVSAGNNGDLTDTGGAPGNATSALTVASTVDSSQLRDGLEVDAPSNLAGIAAGQMAEAYDWAANGPTGEPVSGTVATIPGGNADGCDPLSPADAALVDGKVAWLEWDDDDATRRCGSAGRAANVREAGAIGAIFTSDLDVFAAGISGDATIPVFQLPRAGTARLRAAAEAGTLEVTFDGSRRATINDNDNAISDTLSSFSSRGSHGSQGPAKPDVAAPGDTIASAGVGTGTGPAVISGTSMAAPHTAGIAAVLRARYPSYSPMLVKALVMNSATHDVWTKKNRTGLRYGPARVGAGRVDAALAATTRTIAYSPGTGGPVSASFGPVPAPVTQSTVVRTLPLKVRNTSTRAQRYSLAYSAIVSQPGVSYSVSPSTLNVRARSEGNATVTMRVTPSALRHTIDPTMARTQLDVPRQYVSDASGRVLVTPAGATAMRVPVYGAAKPVSETTATADAERITMAGTGFQQGSGRTGWTSFASVLELGKTSGNLPTCLPGQLNGCATSRSEQAGDLKHVGAGSSGDRLWFGLSTYADWGKVGTTLSPYVDYDTTGDGEPDFQTYVAAEPGSDVLVAVTFDLNDPDQQTVDIQPVNFNWGDVDTNVFDTNVLLLPVSKEALDLGEGSAPISYTVGTYSTITGGDIDRVGPVAFDAGTPALSTSGPLYRDVGGAAVDYTVSGTAPVKALVLHLHGAAGKRAQVLDLPVEPGTPRSAPPVPAPVR